MSGKSQSPPARAGWAGPGAAGAAVTPGAATASKCCSAIEAHAEPIACHVAGLPDGIDRQSLARLTVDLNQPATCAGCGCTDTQACPEGCFWLAVDRSGRSGICSSCPDALDGWLKRFCVPVGGAA